MQQKIAEFHKMWGFAFLCMCVLARFNYILVRESARSMFSIINCQNSVVTVLLFTVIAAGVITGCGIGDEGDGRVRAAVADAGSSQDGNGSSQESGLPKSESEAKVESPQRNLPRKRKRRQKPLRRNPQRGRRTFTP